MSDLYREKVTDLCRALKGDEASRVGARERIRGLIDEISLAPQQDRLAIVLKGNPAGMLRPAQNNNRPSETRTKYSWLRGRATSGTCSYGAGRLSSGFDSEKQTHRV
jgi:hypothetical protein